MTDGRQFVHGKGARGLRNLAREAGLERTVLDEVGLEPGTEHVHSGADECFLYVLDGSPDLISASDKIQLGPGDFVALDASDLPCCIRNQTADQVRIILGGPAGANNRPAG